MATHSHSTTQSYMRALLCFGTGYTGAHCSVNPANAGITFKGGAKMSYVNTLKMFVRVYELGSMSAAARDQRTSPAVASARVSELEKHLGVRLSQRTTRSLQPTENGRIFFDGAKKVLEAIDEAEAAVMDVTQNPKGTIFVSAPLGVGRRFIAPHVPVFKDLYPQIDVRLRLSDRVIDVTAEGLDVAFHLGILEDSTLKVRLIADCPRVLCAAPAYIARRGMPVDGAALVAVAVATPPLPTQLSSLSQHRRLKDPKVKLFTDFMAAHVRDAIRKATVGPEGEGGGSS